MQTPTLQEIDKIRQDGFRPQVVGCIIFGKNDEKEILFVYKKKYKLWQLPQGGIDNGENTKTATTREITEELGSSFASSLNIGTVIGEDNLLFPEQIQGSRKLKTDTGEDIFMLGKKYFFVPIIASTKDLDITTTEFDDYRWVTYTKAMQLIEKIYQKGKKQTILKALTTLHNQNIF